jgi:hypothetical protein
VKKLLLAPAAALLFLSLAGVSADTPKSLRHLVYNFTYATSSDTTEHDSGLSGGPVSGLKDYSAGDSDKGTITIDVTAVDQANGVIEVNASEDARASRSAHAARCDVYSNTKVICDPDAKVNEEELAVMQFMGMNFVTQDALAAKKWHIDNSQPPTTSLADFSIGGNANGILSISQTRTDEQKGAQAATQTINSKIQYNVAKTIPLSVDEDTMSRTNQGLGQYNTQHTQIHAQLTTDSFGAV